MADPKEQIDPRELESLRMSFEKELERRNNLRSQILVSEGFSSDVSEEEVYNFLSHNDERVLELLKDPDFHRLAVDILQLPVISVNKERQAQIDDLREALLMMDSIEEQEKYKALLPYDIAIFKEWLSVVRTQALLYRKTFNMDPIGEYAHNIATYFILDLLDRDLPIPDAIKNIISEEEINRIIDIDMAFDDIDTGDAEEQIRILNTELGVNHEPTYEEYLGSMENEEKFKQALTKLGTLVPDYWAFARQVLNAKDGKLPV